MGDFFYLCPGMNGILLFLNISGGEILLIVVVIYLVFGPKKIPELARMLGKGINEMRRATSEIKDEISREISNARKDIDMNLDIDRGDPLGIKKTMEDAMNGTNKPEIKKKPVKENLNKPMPDGSKPIAGKKPRKKSPTAKDTTEKKKRTTRKPQGKDTSSP